MNIIAIISWKFNDRLIYIKIMESVECNSNKIKPFNHIFNIQINKNKYFIGYTLLGSSIALYKINFY